MSLRAYFDVLWKAQQSLQGAQGMNFMAIWWRRHFIDKLKENVACFVEKMKRAIMVRRQTERKIKLAIERYVTTDVLHAWFVLP